MKAACGLATGGWGGGYQNVLEGQFGFYEFKTATQNTNSQQGPFTVQSIPLMSAIPPQNVTCLHYLHLDEGRWVLSVICSLN